MVREENEELKRTLPDDEHVYLRPHCIIFDRGMAQLRSCSLFIATVEDASLLAKEVQVWSTDKKAVQDLLVSKLSLNRRTPRMVTVYSEPG